ncbi:uncharacterized protein LOC121770291 [Salvia splendens]|uniref:uncharacterized protein LOC121770291 n=1 Tax=Salvia splendens TaxID=180675 RepID=UPI001C27A8F8|nr:uncharacterized protein LOC121770291 [Salvia splendens]
MNMNTEAGAAERRMQLQELEELLLDAYDSAMWYKEKIKMWHDKNLRKKELKVGQRVLLVQSRLKLMPGKLRSRWIGPYTIIALRKNGAIELQGSNLDSPSFMVNGQVMKGRAQSLKMCQETPTAALKGHLREKEEAYQRSLAS